MVCVIVFVETGHVRGLFSPRRFPAGHGGRICRRRTLEASLAAHPRHALRDCRRPARLLDRLESWRNVSTSAEDSRFFKRSISSAPTNSTKQYGGKTIILARFVPIIRTFCPPVAGAAKMSYARYLAYDIVGGLLWVWGMILLGYTLGRTVPNIDKHIHYMIAAVIVVSLIPAAYHAWKGRRQRAH